jgi:hypothetical protein
MGKDSQGLCSFNRREQDMGVRTVSYIGDGGDPLQRRHASHTARYSQGIAEARVKPSSGGVNDLAWIVERLNCGRCRWLGFGEKTLDATAEIDQRTGDNRTDALKDQETGAWINVSMGLALESEAKGN